MRTETLVICIKFNQCGIVRQSHTLTSAKILRLSTSGGLRSLNSNWVPFLDNNSDTIGVPTIVTMGAFSSGNGRGKNAGSS